MFKHWNVDGNADATDLGKVLAGIQAPPEDSDAFDAFLKELGYPYVEETDNAVYKRYMRS